ncbi:MAG: biotin/lipoyl-containing protein, partial [Devosia sp.]|nr:biotin/lipoyl-containing protein [Devosia sp.]
MSINITMPALSPTMEEGKLSKWHVKEGDSVSSGDVIAEIETDKATMEVEAVDEGKIGKIVVPEGTDNVKVNAGIAVLLTEGETASTAAPAAAPVPAPKAPEAQKVETPKAAAAAPATAPASAAPIASGSAVIASPAPKPAAAPAVNGARIFASPLARRLAKEANIDVSAITGSGPHGRVVKADVEAAKSGKVPLKAASVAAPAAGGTMPAGMTKVQVMALYEEGSYDVVPNDGMRKVVA